MKGKDYRESRRRKEDKLRDFEKRLDSALLNKKYVEWHLEDMYRVFVEKNYVYSVIGTEIDLYSFNPHFNVKSCRKNIVKQLYFQKRSRKIGRFVIQNLSDEQLEDCKKAGLKITPRKYRIYKKKNKTA